MQQREVWVDYAKAIGIILVVYGHVARGIYNSGMDIPFKLYGLIDSVIYSFHMPLFFFLSGLFFYNSYLKQGGVKLIGRKIDFIVYPYILWSIIQGVIEAFLSGYTNSNIEYSEVFSLLWAPRAQFWFLYALFVAFCLAAIIFLIRSKNTAIVVFILSIITYVNPSILPDWYVFRFISNNFVYFAAGIVFSLYFRADRLSTPLSLCLLACGFVICQFMFHHTFELNSTDKGLASLLLVFVSILFTISLSVWASSTPNKLFVLIGSSSMAIYLMHILASSGVRVFLKTFIGIDSHITHLVAGGIVGVFMPILALVIIKKFKIPYMFSAPISNAVTLFYNRVFQKGC